MIVCIYDIFKNNLGIDYEFKRYFKESCRQSTDQIFFSNIFLKMPLSKRYPQNHNAVIGLHRRVG